MSVPHGIRKALFAAPLLCAASAIAWASFTPAPVVPALGVQVEFDDALALPISNLTYYNNALHTKVVGQFGFDCCNNPVAWGKKTQYVTSGGCFPCFPPPQ